MVLAPDADGHLDADLRLQLGAAEASTHAHSVCRIGACSAEMGSEADQAAKGDGLIPWPLWLSKMDFSYIHKQLFEESMNNFSQ